MTTRLRTAVRIMPAVWFGPATWLVAIGYAATVPAVDHFALAASANGSAALPFIAAYVCAVSAWEGARLRRGGIWGAPWARSSLTIAARPILLAVGFGFIAVLAAVQVQLARAGASTPDARILVIAGVDLVAWGIVGFAVGVTLPLAWATPVALILPFFWLAFVPAMDPVWLRHITGMFRDCCRVDEDLAPTAVVASTAADVGLIVAASIVAIAQRGRLWRHLAVSGVTFSFLALIATSFVSGLGYAPAVARDPASLMCRKLPMADLCLWPEHADRAAALAVLTSNVLQGWQRSGITPPSIVTEANSRDAAQGELVVSFADVHGDRAAILALARGAVPAPPNCSGGASAVLSATTGGVAEPYLEAWYASAGGLSPSALAATYSQYPAIGPSIEDVVGQLAQSSADQRARWLAKVTTFVTSCDPVQPDVTVVP